LFRVGPTDGQLGDKSALDKLIDDHVGTPAPSPTKAKANGINGVNGHSAETNGINGH
jgi:hypothetical protein